MKETLQSELTWLAQLQDSLLLGICFIDKDGRPIQQFSQDPLLRQYILEYQQEKVRQLQLLEQGLANAGFTIH